MRTITETWAAGETKEFPIAGERFEILASDFPVDVSFQDAHGAELTNGRAQGIGAGSYKSTAFGRLAITSANAQIIRFLIADGDAGTRSVAGTVEVVDGGKSRTMAGSAFLATAGITSAAGQFAEIHFFNPAASGKNCYIKKIYISSNVTISGGIRTSSVAVGALVNKAQSKRAGGVPSQLESRVLSTAVRTGSLSTLQGMNVPGGQMPAIVFEEPIMLPPGYGMFFCTDQHEVGVNMTIEMVEENA